MGFSRQEYWSGLPFPFKGIFLTQRLNSCLLHCRQILHHLSRQGSPMEHSVHFSSVQSLSRVRLFATPWTAARQSSLSITNSQSLLKLMSIKSVMPSNHLVLCHSIFLLTSIFPSIRVFSNESVLHNRWPKYWSFSFSISPSSEYSGLISFRMEWFDLIAVQGALKSFLHHHSSKASNSSALSFLYNPALTSIHDYLKNQSCE